MATFWITYWSGTREEGAVPASVVSSEALPVTGTSAQSGVTPDAAEFVSIYSDVAGNFDYSSSNPTASATTSHHVGANERLWFAARPGRKIAGITT